MPDSMLVQPIGWIVQDSLERLGSVGQIPVAYGLVAVDSPANQTPSSL